MKNLTKLTLSLCFIFLTSGIMAQSTLIKVIEDYSELDKSDYVMVNAADINLGDNTGDHMVYLVNNLETIRILEIEKDKNASEEMYQKARDILKNDPFIEIVSVKNEDALVSIYVNKKGDDQILESALLVKEGKSATIIYMKGDFSLKKIGGITQLMNEELMKNIKVHGEHIYHHKCDKQHK